MDPRTIFGHIFTVESAIAGVVFAGVCLVMFVAFGLSARRRRRGQQPTRAEGHQKVELTYAAFVAVVAAYVIHLSFSTNAQEATHSSAKAAQIRINGYQWCWTFAYPGSRRRVTATCAHGDIPTMYVPIGRPVTLSMTSSDVIHSWWVPALRYKLDAFPGHRNATTLRFDHAGRWIGRCAEFCGEQHTFMDFYVQAVPEKQYEQWLAGGSAT